MRLIEQEIMLGVRLMTKPIRKNTLHAVKSGLRKTEIDITTVTQSVFKRIKLSARPILRVVCIPTYNSDLLTTCVLD